MTFKYRAIAFGVRNEIKSGIIKIVLFAP